jgi:asparagine synthase (glutamine-hydrolysing)
MQAQSTRRVRTFTIGFQESSYNEAEHAKLVAKHLGTDHTELYITSADAMAVIPRLASIYDEPFADSSQIPSVLVSQLARRHVTVGLSGDGGDELFGGYPRYRWAKNIWRRTGWAPHLVKKLAAQALRRVSVERWNAVFARCNNWLPAQTRQRSPGRNCTSWRTSSANSPGECIWRWFLNGRTQPRSWWEPRAFDSVE